MIGGYMRLTYATGLGAAVINTVLLALSGTAAVANDGLTSRWMPFGREPGAPPVNFERQLIRRWEKNPPRGLPTISRRNIAPTKAAIRKYEGFVKRGGWKPIPAFPKKLKLSLGVTNPLVAAVRTRLHLSGHLRVTSSYPDYFDYDLEKAVERFQAGNGLTPTGIVGGRTRKALNVSAKSRLRQLRLNLGRLRTYARSKKSRYVVVNIPAAQIEAVENGRVVSRHTGVVGKIDRKTPILSSVIHELNFNPIWRLPPTVIRKDLIPKGRRMQRAKKNVLIKYGIDAYGSNGRKLDPKRINWNSSQPFRLRYRQQPGPDNPLGFVKINFHNQHSVYLHDTPSDRVFGRNFRAASSGCVRVGNIEPLLSWLLSSNKQWDGYAVQGIRDSGKTRTVRLRRKVPLHMVYLTAWATEDGAVHFRRDLYRRDGVGRLAAVY
ncbi:MAG: L,D-transpeptidase family protein [Hyphomicrobiaceae bacterium]